MRLRTYDEMLTGYNIEKLDPDDQRDRLQMMSTYPYSIIVEAEHMELDGLCNWIGNNLGNNSFNWLHYGKTGYDFGFAEFFFKESNHAKSVADIVPNIYTIYPLSLNPDKAHKSDGYNHQIEHDANDRHAIIYRPPNAT